MKYHSMRMYGEMVVQLCAVLSLVEVNGELHGQEIFAAVKFYFSAA
jgi:hypothetical protein